jgi:hypothetical protein
MRVDELERELRSMAADQPPVASGRTAVRQRHRRRRTVQVGASVIVVVAVLAAALAWRSSTTSSSLQVVTTPTSTSSGAIPAPGELAHCFSAVSPSPGPNAVTATNSVTWPSGVGNLLITTDGGGIYAFEGGQLHRWASIDANQRVGEGAYLWARWGNDGLIYASRLEFGRGVTTVGGSVVIDRLNAHYPGLPGNEVVRTAAVRLPFTIAKDAPAGVCPIDGYLAGFAIGPEGYLLLKHEAGILAHSCPPPPSGRQDRGPTTTEDPWRCASSEAMDTEPRTRIDHAAPTRDGYGATPSSPLPDLVPVLSDSTGSGAVLLATGGDQTLEDFGATPSCCDSTGRADAYALSPDGLAIAHAEGNVISIDRTELAGASQAGPWPGPWHVDGPVTAMAWSGDWLAVAHGDTLSLLSTKTGGGVEIAHLETSIRDLDFSR